MLLPAVIPLAYQLLQAYQPESILPANPTVQIVANPTPTPSSSPAKISSNQPVRIGVLGDSMIATLDENMPQLAKSLAKYFPNTKFNLLNFGASSTTIEQAVSRLPQLISQKPDIIVVESFAYNNFGNTQAGYDRQWLALGAITSEIKQKLPNTKIVLAATIAPNSVVYANGISNLNLNSLDKAERTKTIRLYLQNLINFAQSQGYPLADTYHLSLSQDEGMTNLISTTDHLHPSDYGKEVFCDTLADTIAKNKLIE